MRSESGNTGSSNKSQGFERNVKNGKGKRSNVFKSKPDKDKQKKFRKWSLGLLIVVTLITTVVIIHQKWYSGPNEMRMSRVLRRFVKTANQRIDHELQMQTLLLDDPLVDLIKNGLRPIQERLSSIRTQTSQYEKMGHIKGGPTNFMGTALKEINTDIEIKMLRLNFESLNILKEVSQRASAVAKNGREMVVSGALLLDDYALRMMASEGGIIIPPSNADPVEINRLAEEVTFEEVTNMLDGLASLYEELENAVLKAISVGKEMTTGVEDIMDLARIENELEDDDYDKILPYFEQIQIKKQNVSDYRERNGKYLQVFQLLTGRNSERLMNMVIQCQNYHDEKQRPFLQLRDFITKDLVNLKIRIENLKYKYAKRSMEL